MFWKHFFTFELEYFDSYLQLIERSIQSDWQKLKAEEETMKKAGIKPILDDFGRPFDPYDVLADEAHHTHRPEQLMLMSFVMSIFAFTEYNLNRICKIIQNEQKSLFSYKDLHGSGISKAKKYIDTIYDTNFPTDTNLQSDLRVLVIVRNCLTHNDGVIKKNDVAEINSYLKCNPEFFEVDNLRRLRLKVEYARHLIDFVKKIQKELESVVKALN